MQRKNYIIFLISIFSFTLFGVFIFFICDIGIGLSYVKSANADIQQQKGGEKNQGNSVSYRHIFSSNETVNTSEQKML